MRREESFFDMQTNTNLRKTFRRRLIRVSHQSLICSFALSPLCGIVGIALLSESVLAIPSSMELQIVQQPVTTESDVTSAAAEKAVAEATQLYRKGDKVSLEQAIVKYKEALKLWQEVGDRRGEATTLNNIGSVYSDLGDNQQALRYYKQAFPLRQQVGDRRGEAATLNNIGVVYADLGDNQQALKYYNDALPLRQQVGNRGGAATTLNNIGSVYSDLGNNQKALEYYKDALDLMLAVGDRRGKAVTLNNIGVAYSDLGDNQQALTYYNDALDLMRAVGDRRREAVTLNNIGVAHADLGDDKQALKYYQEARSLSQDVGDRRGEAATLISIGSLYADLGERQQRLTYYNDALSLSRAVDNRGGEAITLTNIESIYDRQQALTYYNQALPLSRPVGDRGGAAVTLSNIVKDYDLQQPLKYYEQALRLSREVGDRRGQATALNNIGSVYADLGDDRDGALRSYKQALSLSEELGDRRGQAVTLSNIGRFYADLDEQEQALKYYKDALRYELDDRRGQAVTLNNIGRVYADLGEQEQARTSYEQALSLSQKLGDRRGQAAALNNIGRVDSDLRKWEQARTSYAQALSLSQELGDRRGEAAALNNIGRVYAALGEQEQARTSYEQALSLSKKVGDRRGEAAALNNIGRVYADLREWEQALTSYNDALSLSQAVGDRAVEADTLNNIGRVERKQGNWEVALKRIDKAIEIVENLRVKITSPELRISYFATKQDIYQFKIDLLMELHKQNPSTGYDIKALVTTERSRARSLIELLAESKADIQAGIELDLLKSERDLDRRRDILERAKEKLASIKDSDAARSDLDRQINLIIKEQEELRTKIGIVSPNYAALKFPEPLTSEGIQKVLDDDTLLLTYFLGVDRSYLWLVSKTKIQSYELPKRSEIEEQAQEFYDRQKIDPRKAAKDRQSGLDLSKILLPLAVANELDKKRLLIVADGALQSIPFATLPLCKDATCNNPSPLITNNEIVNAPSISTIDIIRTPNPRRKHTKTLAVIADPVFGTYNELCQAEPECKKSELIAQVQSKSLAEEQFDRSGIRLGRVFGTRDSADKILNLVEQENMKLKQVGFDANLAFVTNDPELGKYRYILFATHGIFNPEQPEFSGLVLSRVDKYGKFVRGFLQLNDIFNLKLSADLVVLSACETGLGKEIKGEGSIGLTRGFMYAGAPRVVVSLWKVSDDGTAELMKKFYTNILQKKLTPAAALRAAQLAMSQDTKYSDPYYWAGFTLQGEWR